MSRPHYGWWPYAKDMIRQYPKLCAQIAEIKRTSLTPNYDQIGHGYDVSRPTENAALRQLSKTKQREFDAVRRSLENLKQYPNYAERLVMVQQVFWRKDSLTLDAVSVLVHYSHRTVKEWHRKLIYDVARNYGLLD